MSFQTEMCKLPSLYCERLKSSICHSLEDNLLHSKQYRTSIEPLIQSRTKLFSRASYILMSFRQVRIICFGENEDKKRIGEHILLYTLSLEEHLYYIIDLHYTVITNRKELIATG